MDAAAYRQAAEKALGETGEPLPGVEVVPERESFTIRFGSRRGGAVVEGGAGIGNESGP